MIGLQGVTTIAAILTATAAVLTLASMVPAWVLWVTGVVFAVLISAELVSIIQSAVLA